MRYKNNDIDIEADSLQDAFDHVVDPQGVVWFDADDMHFEIDTTKTALIPQSPPCYDYKVSKFFLKSKEQLGAELWNDANAFAESQMDNNSRHSIDMLLASGTATQQQMERIVSHGNWWKSLWNHYATKKAKIAAGEYATFEPEVVGNAPYTIWEIVA